MVDKFWPGGSIDGNISGFNSHQTFSGNCYSHSNPTVNTVTSTAHSPFQGLPSQTLPYRQTRTNLPISDRSAFSVVPVPSSYEAFSKNFRLGTFDQGSGHLNPTLDSQLPNSQVPYNGQIHSTVVPIQQSHHSTAQSSVYNQSGFGSVIQDNSLDNVASNISIAPVQPQVAKPSATALFSLQNLQNTNTQFQTNNLYSNLPNYSQPQSYLGVHTLPNTCATQPLIQPAVMTSSQSQPQVCTLQDPADSHVQVPLDSNINDPSMSSNQPAKQSTWTSNDTAKLSNTGDSQGQNNQDSGDTRRNSVCSQDVLFIGEVQKPELNDKSSDIIFVRKNFNRSGVVCLTPSRKLRKKKSSPYCKPIVLDDDPDKCKVTISQTNISTKTLGPVFSEWSYELASGPKMFDQETTSLLEYLYNCNSNSNITITLPSTGETYKVNLQLMTMVNTNNNEEIVLCRRSNESNISQPPPSSPGLSDFPIHWSPQTNDIELVAVTRTSENNEWFTIEDSMRRTLPNIYIERIERIQNKKLWIRYAFQKAMLMDKNGLDENVNEKLLFHGTTLNPPCMIWQSEDGFDMRYCKSGAWGLGTYFAQEAVYSNNYAHRPNSSSPIRQMLVASVLTGHSINLAPDATLRRPPIRIHATATQPEIRYDSVTGIAGPSKTRIYVLYKFDMAYPSYLVTYSIW